ncbi:23804_t:CDS:2, partial [Racocetra persica]
NLKYTDNGVENSRQRSDEMEDTLEIQSNMNISDIFNESNINEVLPLQNLEEIDDVIALQ